MVLNQFRWAVCCFCIGIKLSRIESNPYWENKGACDVCLPLDMSMQPEEIWSKEWLSSFTWLKTADLKDWNNSFRKQKWNHIFPPSWVLEEPKKPSTTFLGGPVLLLGLIDWFWPWFQPLDFYPLLTTPTKCSHFILAWPTKLIFWGMIELVKNPLFYLVNIFVGHHQVARWRLFTF